MTNAALGGKPRADGPLYSRRKKGATRRARLAVAALAVSLAVSTFAGADDWTYDTSGRTDATPASSDEGFCAGLDAKARGFDDNDVGIGIDAWYWTRDFAECVIKCTPYRGGMIIVR